MTTRTGGGAASIDTRSTVSLPIYVASVVGGITLAISITLWIVDRGDSQSAMMETIRKEIRDVAEQVKELSHFSRDRWGAANMEVFALRLKNGNPSLHVPDVREIRGAR